MGPHTGTLLGLGGKGEVVSTQQHWTTTLDRKKRWGILDFAATFDSCQGLMLSEVILKCHPVLSYEQNWENMTFWQLSWAVGVGQAGTWHRASPEGGGQQW